MGCGNGSTAPQFVNRDPVIDSVRVQPMVANVTDSILVTCFAVDPDGDTLVYDWQTDSRLRIRGVPADQPYKFNSFSASEWFYPHPQYVPTTLDTIYMSCKARDRRGGGDARLVLIIVEP